MKVYCKNVKTCKSAVKGSLVPVEDAVDDEADVPVESAREALYEMAELFGYESVFNDLVEWFSAWDLQPVANSILSDAGMVWEE